MLDILELAGAEVGAFSMFLVGATSWIPESVSEYVFKITYPAYFVVGVASLTVMGFWMVLNVLGFGAGTDALDAADAADALDGADAMDGMDAAEAADAGEAMDSSASVFTFRSILAFFGGFGWSGVLAIELGLSAGASFLVSIPVGVFFMLLTYGVLLFLLTMSASGSLDYKNAIGETGEVYISIPPNREGAGKVRVQVQGRLKTISAYNASDQEAETHSRVRVVDQIDSSTLLVKPLSEVSSDS
jgi:membrane protein implicated in regulation of membrane protease activity